MFGDGGPDFDPAPSPMHGDGGPDLWGAGLLVALTGSLTQSLVDGVLVMPLSQTGLMCCAGLAVAWVQSAKPRAPSPEPWGGNSALATGVGLGSQPVAGILIGACNDSPRQRPARSGCLRESGAGPAQAQVLGVWMG